MAAAGDISSVSAELPAKKHRVSTKVFQWMVASVRF